MATSSTGSSLTSYGPDGITRAALLGVAGGMRTTLPLAALTAHGRIARSGPGRYAVYAATAAEFIGDKAPSVPGRIQAQGIYGRLTTSAVAGRVLGGWPGAAAGLAGALVGTYASFKVRADLTDELDLSEPVVAGIEDVSALVIGAVATANLDEQTADSDQDDAPPPVPGSEPGLAARIGLGLAAGAAGTVAMTAAQLAYYQLSGEDQSVAPANIADKIGRGLFGRRVPRKRRTAVNWAMHAAYGTAWGAAYGLAAGSASERPPLAASGLAFGGGVWASSLVELPAFDQAPPFWRMPPFHLALDAGFHVLYGLSTAAAYRALKR